MSSQTFNTAYFKAALCAAALLAALFAVPSHGEWGSISVSKDASDNFQVVLENSKFKCTYGTVTKPYTDIKETTIREFSVKAAGGADQVGAPGYMDAQVMSMEKDRGVCIYADVVRDGADTKTVRMVWDNGQVFQDITMTKDSPVLKMDYYNYGITIRDFVMPGGNEWGEYSIYGGGSYTRKEGILTLSGYQYPASYYRDADGTNDPADGGALSYNGWFIIGVYADNGQGYVRVMPVKHISVIKALYGRGWEWAPHYGTKGDPVAFTGYLGIVSGGGGEIQSLGKSAADNAPGMEPATVPPLPITPTIGSTMLQKKRAPAMRIQRTGGYVAVSVAALSKHQLRVFTPNGRTVYAAHAQGTTTYRVPVRTMANGLYVFQVKTEAKVFNKTHVMLHYR
ncbi:MAG: hypothetical protein GF418_13455 [Chitinivibrionales bacterium]|nr:hypothetical protein [Chitinivibrionales bacterium]MBD3396626.1 hypothetical protein [Chitinivibrionales bacterium]